MTNDTWISLFNGEDLRGWTPKFSGEELGVNYKNTFQARDGVLVVCYDEYESFDNKFGHLFYEHEYSNYDLELEYRFIGEQVPGGPGWAFRNNGVMIHGQSPLTMRVDQDFPVSIEVQLLGAPESGEGARATGNLCTPGTNVVYNGELDLRHCINSESKTFRGDQWVKMRIEVQGSELIRHFINGEEVMHYTQPQLDDRDRDAQVLIDQREGDKLLTGGTISLQAESHGTEFRRIRLLAAERVGEQYPVTAPPAELELPEFYAKYVSANGYPIVSSARVSDHALKEAAFLIDMLLAERADVREAMIAGGSRMVVMAYDEFTTDVPEQRSMEPKDYWDARARGLGGSRTDPLCSSAEENLLAFEGDPYSTECILIHEFAHNIHLRGMVEIDPTFDDRLKQAYEHAISEGLWATKYASVNHVEYFAEGVQSWFDDNRAPDHDHNHVDTRAELQEYDPRLAALCAEVFGTTELEYTKPATRLHGHLEGYDPSTAPRFEWPARLEEQRRTIRAEAKTRDREKPYTK
ncbi:MAG: family 16 glycoside hydrolase [Phycisphaerales bacterium]